MPKAIGKIALAVGLVAVAALTGGIGLIGFAAVAAATYAVTSATSAVYNSLFRANVGQKSSEGQQSLQQPIPFRRRIYGRAKVGGYFIFWESVNGALYQLMALAAHAIDAVEEHWIGDRRVAINGSGWVTSVNYPPSASPTQFNPDGLLVVQVITRLGAAGQAAMSALTSAFPGIWTADHVGIGIADALLVQKSVKQEKFTTVYPGGPQNYRAVLRGAKIKDIRALGSSPAWGSNAVNVVRDYMTDADGWRIDTDFFDTGLGLPISQDSANICDELVTLKSGGSERRYRIWGFYEFNEQPRSVLSRLLAACGGWLQPQPDGTIAIKVGAWEEPDVTITQDHILSYDVQRWSGEFDAINEVRASFADPLNDYQDTESRPWQDEADIARRGHIRTFSVDARHCPSFSQTRRVQKIAMAESSPEWQIGLTTDAYGLMARNRRFIRLQLDELGLDITCRVTSFVADIQTGQCSIGLASFGEEAYAWDPETEEGDPPPLAPDTSNDGTIELPTGMDVEIETRTVSGSTVGTVMVVFCDTPADRDDLYARFEFQVDGGSSWTQVPPGTDSFRAETGFIADGTYNVRASLFGPSGVQSDFVYVYAVVVSPTTTAPSAPTGLHATPGSPAVTVLVEFTAPNSGNFYAARVWRNTTATFGTATDISGPVFGSPNQALSYTDTPGVGTKYYWATAENSSGADSSPAGPVSVTI